MPTEQARCAIKVQRHQVCDDVARDLRWLKELKIIQRFQAMEVMAVTLWEWLTVRYSKWRNREVFPSNKWWFSSLLCKHLPEGIHPYGFSYGKSMKQSHFLWVSYGFHLVIPEGMFMVKAPGASSLSFGRRDQNWHLCAPKIRKCETSNFWR